MRKDLDPADLTGTRNALVTQLKDSVPDFDKKSRSRRTSSTGMQVDDTDTADDEFGDGLRKTLKKISVFLF